MESQKIIKKREKDQYTYDDLGDLLQIIAAKERVLFIDLDRTVKKYI